MGSKYQELSLLCSFKIHFQLSEIVIVWKLTNTKFGMNIQKLEFW